MLGPLLVAQEPFDVAAEAALPVVLRTDLPLAGNAEIRRGDGDPVLFVTTIPNFATYRLVLVPDPANRLLTEGFGSVSITKPVYALMIRLGGEDLVPRLFHGEPTAEAFAHAVSGLVIDELPPPMVPVERAAREAPE